MPNMSLPKLLFVGHDAIHAGAQVVLLEVVKWFANHTRHPIKVLLFGAGRLVPQYAEYADTHVMIDSLADVSWNKALQKFLNDKFSACYVNTVASSRFWKLIGHFPAVAQAPLILHVHEMEMVIRDYEEDFNKIIPYVSSIIAVSAAVRDTLTNIFICDPNKIFLSNAFVHVIANTPYDAALRRQVARLDLQLSSSDFVVIGCGTVYSRKGPDLFLDVAFKCMERSSIPNAKFVWIGSGDDLESLRGKVASRGLSDRIRFIGVRDNANELIAAADVFFLSSREDPFPLVCLEAAQYGIPTVYFTGATGISEFCGKTAGVGVKAFDTNAVLQAIHLYYSQPSRLEKAGAAARARILEGYTAEKRILEVALHLQKICHLRPSVSVIVPAYNHEKFIRDRIESILSQTILDIEIIILDDCSSDSTALIAQEYLSDPRVRFERNEVNSGSPFIQWSKGAQMANSELVWIAEGDDLATDNFLAATLPAFDDPLVNLAFCRTEIVDEFGVGKPGALDPYYKMSDFPFHGPGVKMDGLTAIESGFGSMCLIVNGSSTIIKRKNLISGAAVAQSYKMCGDWFVYLSAISDAKLVYVTEATNFFRRHSASAVHKVEGTPQYFDERARIANYVVDTFSLSRRAFRLLTALLDGEWTRFANRNPGRTKDEMFDAVELLKKYSLRHNKPFLKIGFYVHGMLFSKGGIERLASQLANGLANLGHSIYIFCREWGGARPVYSLNESITVIDVFNEDDISQTASALRIELAKRDLDVFVPMLSEWLFEPLVDACHGLGIPIIASEHNDPAKIEELWWSRPGRLACFEKVDAVHLLLDRYKTSLPETFQDRIYTVPNGVVVTEDVPDLLKRDRPKRIIGVGRLERQKRFDRLVKAFIAASANMPGWRLDIYGEGSERNMLQGLIDQSGLSESIAMRGTSQIIAAELEVSSIFVLASEFEGLPIVILEAKQAGLPCISYADCNGPSDLIRHEVDGLLVEPDEDATSLAAALSYLAAHDDIRQDMGIAGREDAKRFDIRLVVQQWEKMLIAVAKPKVGDAVVQESVALESECSDRDELMLASSVAEDAPLPKDAALTGKSGRDAGVKKKAPRQALSKIE
jgi:glycosyltransferase involved in cell wall biosynthesis